MKLFKGMITNIRHVHLTNPTEEHLGYYLLCDFIDHPRFAGKSGNTSMVVKNDENKPRHKGDGYYIETLNSRYLVKED